MKARFMKAIGLFIVLSMLVTPVSAQTVKAPAVDQSGPQLENVSADGVELVQSNTGSKDVLYEEKGASGPATYIIQLAASPLASYRGGIAGLRATSPAETGAKKLDVNSTASQDYRAYLATERQKVLGQIEQEIARSVTVQYVYDVAYNGVAIELTPEEAAQVAQMPGVVRVIRNFTRYIQTDTSPEYLNAVGIWDGSNTGTLPGTMGEGMVVGIIDTGINMDSRSFADVGDDGYDHTNPRGQYYGWCNPSDPDYDATLICNDKLIGVHSYPDSGNDPEDDHSHGSHTASTTAGNVVYSATLQAGLIFNQISGMAPHANIIAYDVCTATGGCQGTSIMAAIDDAVADQVDVINYSIGGDPTDPWNDPDSEAYLNARDAGVMVVTSAGNDGPDAGTLGSPGNSPWMMTVANGTHDRGFAPNGLVNMAGGTPPADMSGTGVSGEYTARIVHASDYGNALCGLGSADAPTNPFTPGTWAGEIVVCDRGTYYLVDKAAHVLEAGAGGVIIANTTQGTQTYATDLGMPGTHVNQVNGDALRAWLVSSNTNIYSATITTSPVVHDAALGGILSATSSRGPNVNADLIKPDIMAPGSNILAAYAGDADSYGLMSGTSMASPHVAGAATLMRDLHPSWTSAEVQSALMMTSWTEDLFKEDGSTPADPFDVGAGRLDLTNASLAGLVLDETTANFQDADPSTGGDPTTLNLASLANDSCLSACSWERTFRNTTGEVVTWTVTVTGEVALSANPATFTVAAGATQLVEFTADVSGETNGEWVFGSIILTADDPSLPQQHLPVAVIPSNGILPEEVVINTRRDAGSQEVSDLQTTEVLTLTTEAFGLAPMETADFELGLMATQTDFPDIFYANLPDDAYAAWIPVTDSVRLVVEVLDTTSPDLDMLVAYDANGNGEMDVQDTALHDYCQSASNGPWEYCDIMQPITGNWYVILINFETSEPGVADPVSLGTAIVPASDAGNMWVEGPSSVPALEPFDLRVYWNEPEMDAGESWYGAFSLGTEPSQPGNVGVIPVTIVRQDDDVVKEVSSETAVSGDTLTYTITILPNITPENLTYALTDTIPAGLTYVPGSATATEGTVSMVDDQLTWTGLMPIVVPQYLMSTSNDDPDNCGMPLANSGAYTNLQSYGIFPQPAISGDSIWFTALTSGSTFDFYGAAHTGINFTDDGMAFFSSTPGATPWENADIPNSADPNNLMAILWQDWVVNYDAALNHGVSIATLGGTGETGAGLIEYDDIQVYGEAGQTMDFEVLVWRTVDNTPGAYEVIFAYDNISTTLTIGTVGVENASGTAGTKYAYNDANLSTITDGMAICFDWFTPTGDPVTITYAVTVDENPPAKVLTNNVLHVTDNPGAVEATASVDVTWLDEFTLDVNVVGNGSVAIDPEQAIYIEGDTITLTATADANWAFTGWSGDLTGTDNPLAFEIMANTVVTATFEEAAIDLGIVKTGPETAALGEIITYTLTVSNAGPDGATGVTVTDTLPISVTFLSASPLCAEDGGVVSCAIGDLAADETVVLTVTVSAPEEAMQLTNIAEVAGNEADADPANNTDSAITAVSDGLLRVYLPIIVR
ncbi:MAG: S8 family serine peptidase [Chloroflexota bacterium]